MGQILRFEGICTLISIHTTITTRNVNSMFSGANGTGGCSGVKCNTTFTTFSIDNIKTMY